MIIVKFVYLVEGGGDDLGRFHEITLDPSVVTQTGGDGFGHGYGQLQGVQFICLPGCLGVRQGLGTLGSIGGLPGRAPWVGGGVASLVVGAFPVPVAALGGPVFLATLLAGVFGLLTFLGCVSESLASVALHRFLMGVCVLHSDIIFLQGEAIFEKVVPLSLAVCCDLEFVDISLVLG